MTLIGEVISVLGTKGKNVKYEVKFFGWEETYEVDLRHDLDHGCLIIDN